jgi:N-formylglutamate deformylase
VTLPLLLSVPHAGLDVPPEAASYCRLTPEQIRADGDEGAREIYALESEVAAFATTGVARAIVDLNRPEDDRGADGVVKTHTCWNVPVYDPFPPAEVVEALLERHHRPYHRRLTQLATSGVLLGLDGHTMAATAPPVGPDPGAERPPICLSDGDGVTCPPDWFVALAESLEETFGLLVSRNRPFRGGYITRRHASELPWVQLELSRAPFLTPSQKRERVLEGLREFFRRVRGAGA